MAYILAFVDGDFANEDQRRLLWCPWWPPLISNPIPKGGSGQWDREMKCLFPLPRTPAWLSYLHQVIKRNGTRPWAPSSFLSPIPWPVPEALPLREVPGPSGTIRVNATFSVMEFSNSKKPGSVSENPSQFSSSFQTLSYFFPPLLHVYMVLHIGVHACRGWILTLDVLFSHSPFCFSEMRSLTESKALQFS